MRVDEPVPIPNALTINTIGTERQPFPVWGRVGSAGGIDTVSFGAIRLRHFADLVGEGGHPVAFVYDFGPSEYVVEPSGEWRGRELVEIADDIGVKVLGEDSGTILIDMERFGALAEAADHYQICVLDSASVPADLASLWVAARAHDRANGEPLLTSFPDSSRFIDVHDDCYAYVETRRGGEITLGLLARLLWLAAGTVIDAHGQSPVVSLPDRGTLEQILDTEGSFVAEMADASLQDGCVLVPFSRSPWKLGTVVPDPVATIRYDVDTARWSIS